MITLETPFQTFLVVNNKLQKFNSRSLYTVIIMILSYLHLATTIQLQVHVIVSSACII